jgi:hypothetical protein
MGAGGCDLAYPEVVVTNRISAHVLVRNPSFNGCVWNVTLAYGDSTSPGRCLRGSDHVHFQKLDLDQEASDPAALVWFNYQTISIESVGYGSSHTFEVTADDMEQDFSVPGPYGH